MAESIYLYYSNNDFLLNHAVEDKIKELNVDPFNIVKYDLLENPYDDVLEDLQTVSFFAEKKVIVVRNIQELEKADEYLLQSYLNYFEKPNPDVVVIIVMNELLPESSALGVALFKFAFIEMSSDTFKNSILRRAPYRRSYILLFNQTNNYKYIDNISIYRYFPITQLKICKVN